MFNKLFPFMIGKLKQADDRFSASLWLAERCIQGNAKKQKAFQEMMSEDSFRSILKYSVFGNPHKTARQEPTYSWFWRACFCYMKSFSASKSACAMLPLVHHIFCKLALFT